MVMRYKSRPSEIEAVRWDGFNLAEVQMFGADVFVDRGGTLKLKAGAGGSQEYVPVPSGHWIARDANGKGDDYWPIHPDYLARKYAATGGGAASRDLQDRYYESLRGLIVQVNPPELRDLRLWLGRRIGAHIVNSRLTIEAVDNGGILVRTKPYLNNDHRSEEE
jgi:hypothetical protein